jgi:hypothetical protein
MRKGYITLSIIGMVAAIAVFAMNYFDVNSGLPEGINLQQIDGDFVKYCSKNKRRY